MLSVNFLIPYEIVCHMLTKFFMSSSHGCSEEAYSAVHATEFWLRIIKIQT